MYCRSYRCKKIIPIGRFTVGGKQKTDIDLFEWSKEVESRGAGEILFTSMNNDGTKDGYANSALNQISKSINIPIIASEEPVIWNISMRLLKQERQMQLLLHLFYYDELE